MGMHRKSRGAIFAVVVVAALLPNRIAAAAGGQTLSENIDGEARRVVSSVKQTSYTHKSNIDPATGVYETDCSGLVDYVLQTVLPAHLAQIPLRGKEHRQLAQDYWAAFHAAPTTQSVAAVANDGTGGWARIEKVADARPGDVLAWKNPAHEPGDHTNTGHVMIIDEQPREEPPERDTREEKVRIHRGKIEEKPIKVAAADPHRRYRVVVIDCTGSPHASDSRPTGTSGVGRGTIWLDIDNQGEPIAFHWKLANGTPKEVPIVIGRAVGKE